ncbi:MAG TPA: hypothetical protein VGR55_21375, partial [Candidatus Acidoferrum sp.]|nr:hypothetical protein [Candidatus Acidoferrum sp.]
RESRGKAEGRRQKAEGRRQKAEGRRQKAEGRRQKSPLGCGSGFTKRQNEEGAAVLRPYKFGESQEVAT